MDKLAWCKMQRNGLELVEPNENLSNEYFIKSENALRAVRSLNDNFEWQISSAYYAMYFSLYAILMKVGIKSEIHSCTIEFVHRFLSNYFSKEDIALLRSSLSARIDAQYYTDRIVDDKVRNKMTKASPLFHLKCKEVCIRISKSQVDTIRCGISSI
jgi:uncharacterized protein (UPF0332 family)